MSIAIVVVIVGAVFLAVGLIGGGIRIGVKEGEASIPTLNPAVRIVSIIIGVGFITFGLWRDTNPPVNQIPNATELTSSIPVSTQTERPSPPLIQVSNQTVTELVSTPTDAPVFTSTDLVPSANKILFQDDFENGTSQWTISPPNTWKTEQESNNNYICTISGNDYAYAIAGSDEWENYTFQFDMLIDITYPNSVPLFGTRRDSGDSKYEVIVNTKQSDIYKSVFTWLTKSTHPSFIDGQWHSFKFSVNKDNLTVSSAPQLNIEYIDNDYLRTGKIELGASPNSRVCFDNIQVIAIP